MIQIPITVATMPEVQGTSIGANIASLAIPGWEKVWEKAWELGNRKSESLTQQGFPFLIKMWLSLSTFQKEA